MRLRQTNETPTLSQNDAKVVYNLSDRSKAAEQMLLKGFNYAMAPNKLPVEKILCGIENGISILEPNATETVRQEVCTILRNTHPPKKNLNIEKLKILIELKRNENIVILPTDKGNATVVLNTRDYKDKM
ncbi:hypothetical protein Trydic_g20590 [Trypoxylus dichotomus]